MCWPIEFVPRCSVSFFSSLFFASVERGNAVSDLSNYPQSDRTSTPNRVGFVRSVLTEGYSSGQDLYMTHHIHAYNTPTFFFGCQCSMPVPLIGKVECD